MSLFDENSFTHSVDDSPIFHSNSYDDEFASPPIYASGGGISPDRTEFSPEMNGNVLDGDFGGSDGSILPPPTDMLPDEGFALREWRRQNTVRLEEKEKQEKEMLNQIIDEADEFKIDFYRRREITCESNKTSNREKEKLFMANQEKFYTEADKDYWKSIAELVPNEVPTIAKRGKKDEDKKPSIAVIQGPKPGKPTDLSRMRQILVKLKHNTPPHLKHSPVAVPDKDAKTGVPATISKGTALEASTEPVAVA